jgi:hypothetical protein
MYKLNTDRKGQTKLITHNLHAFLLAKIKQQNSNTEGRAMTQPVSRRPLLS